MPFGAPEVDFLSEALCLPKRDSDARDLRRLLCLDQSSGPTCPALYAHRGIDLAHEKSGKPWFREGSTSNACRTSFHVVQRVPPYEKGASTLAGRVCFSNNMSIPIFEVDPKIRTGG